MRVKSCRSSLPEVVLVDLDLRRRNFQAPLSKMAVPKDPGKGSRKGAHVPQGTIGCVS